MLLDVPDVLLGCPSVEFNNTSRPLPIMERSGKR